LFNNRGTIGALAFVLLFIIAKPKPELLLYGLMPVFAGLLFRLWAKGYIRNQSAGANPSKLIITGPYRLMRNPLYWGNFFLTGGVLLAFGLCWYLTLAVLVLFVVEYFFIIRAEEALLATAFPSEYPSYKHRTGMIFPKTFSLPRGWSTRFSIKNCRGEVKTGLSVAVIYLLLFLKIVL